MDEIVKQSMVEFNYSGETGAAEEEVIGEAEEWTPILLILLIRQQLNTAGVAAGPSAGKQNPLFF